jgi:hypothetical protein
VETLAFYSYKGGVGRSLLLANAARFLASLGKGVVALDLDFEAPGLHYKLGRAASREGGPESLGGAVPYLLATAQGATAAPPLEEHMVEVPVPPESGGWLLLMPAGPAPDRAYWTALKQLSGQVRFDDPSGEGLMPLLDLHARIAEELKPDYLLIDARTGVTELGGLATTILADTVVCMFAANQESLDGTLTVVDALQEAPRLKGHRPVRVVPVLARTTSEPPVEGPFAAGVKRLLELGEGNEAGEKGKRKPFVLPHDDVHGASDRVVGGERKASAFSPLYKAYLELFQKLFPASAKRAQEALGRLEAVASIKENLTKRRERYEFEDSLAPWKVIAEGVSYKPERPGSKDSRYADLICRDAAGRPLMVVEYVAEDAKEEAKEFWGKHSDIRCLVLLSPYQYGVTRKIYSRRANDPDLRETDRWAPPFPREFDLLPDVGDRSVEALLDALRHGHAEAAAWLVSEWRNCITLGGMRMKRRRPSWRPMKARRILDGLAATEDPNLAEQILRHSASSSLDPRHNEWRFRERFDKMSPPVEELDRRMEKELFAPLFWRLPVEAVVKYAEPRRHPDETPSLAGYRLLAYELMGLDYDPDRSAQAESRALALRSAGDEQTDDEEEHEPARWYHRSRRERRERVRLTDDLPPVLIWEELDREDRYWRGTLDEAKEKLSDKAKKLLTSTAGLRRRLREKLDRRLLVSGSLLGEYDATGHLVLYSDVVVAVADLLRVSPRYLKSVVFIHLSVLGLAHQALDLDGQPGYGFAPVPPASPFHRENPVHVTLAQCFAHRLIERLEDPNLMATFEKLSQHQPEAYRQWDLLRGVPLEQMRVFLMRARGGAAAVGLPVARELE